MEVVIKDAMTDLILNKAIDLYDIDKQNIKYLGGFENIVYEYTKDSQNYILRFVHSAHRTCDLVEAEIEFIDYLYHNGGNVSQVVLSENGNTIEKIDGINNDYFVVTSFVKAKGALVKVSEIDDEFNYRFGKAVGKLHALTKTFSPVKRRHQWHEENLIVDLAQRYLKKEDAFVIDKLDNLVAKLKKLPMDIDSYGLIHTDLHFGNIFVDGEAFTFFDFDDSCYKHFISDIAIIIFYQFGTQNLSDSEKEEKTLKLLKHFCKGYLEVNDLSYKWFDHLIDFLKLREIIQYVALYSSGEEMINHPYAVRYFKTYRDRIRNDTPFFNIENVLGID